MDYDYKRGLTTLAQLAKDTDWEQDFRVQEDALRVNLRDEGRFGPSEQSRRDRSRIVDQLNELALQKVKMSFNELCMGKPLPAPSDPAPEPARQASDFKYDAFISYSHQDGEWVENTLLPHLERKGVRVCIDFRDFEIGVASLINMENAVKRSRRVLLVLTPDWIASEFANFEALLIRTQDPAGLRQRTLPLMVRKCTLPDHLQILTYLDMTNPANFAFQIERLVKTILSNESVQP